jgi:MSHA biogenesis protein MshQ
VQRFGRLRIGNAVGSEETPLPVPLQTEFWSGTGFVLNSDDSCTTLAQANIAQGNYQKSLAACQTVASTSTVTFASGLGRLVLTKPGTGNIGSVDLSPQLGASIVAGSKYCATAGGSEAPATAASKSYLQGAWNGAATYDQNPTGRAAFGAYGARPQNYIFLRENY